MKDYFDLWVLSEHAEFDGQTLRQAMAATFERRKTPIPEQIPFGLTAGFTEDTQKQTQWRAFMRKNNLTADALPDIAQALTVFLMPAAKCAFTNTDFISQWNPGGPWEESK